jgi:D-serine deaminase-like pyridoxal phosphate-dependent protein
MSDRGPNEGLIGAADARPHLATPALTLELGVFERNLAHMAETCATAGVALRPHAKTHKCAAIAQRQIEAGAVGICCAKLGEAEAMAEAGIGDILITSPVVTEAGLDRIVALAGRCASLAVVADDTDVIAQLADKAQAAGRTVTVLVDIDPGMHRTGVATPEQAVACARAIRESNALAYGGAQFYAGHVQHLEAFETRKQVCDFLAPQLAAALEALDAADLAPPKVTGGGTGSHALDLAGGVFTELQAGSYVFMDVEYNAVALREGEARPFETALFVLTTVISANARDKGLVTTDGGFKAFSTDGPKPEITGGAPAGATYEFMGDEHGAVIFDKALDGPALGGQVACVTPHCDPTVNLYDVIHVLDGDTLVDIWPVTARGRSQ